MGHLYFKDVPPVVLYVKITPLYLCLLFPAFVGLEDSQPFFPSSGLWLFQPEEVGTKTILPDQQFIKTFAKVRKENVSAITMETWGISEAFMTLCGAFSPFLRFLQDTMT